MSRQRSIAILLAVLLLFLAALTQAREGARKAPPGERDHAAELPRIPPKEPAEALKTFKLRPGFRIELVAAEPLIHSPVALDIDENGRLFVVEYPEYNQYANPRFKGHGCIRMLEDTDGDGRYDKSTLYVDNLNSPVAIACYDGGIFVGAVPDILYCKDTRGDGKVDVRRPVFTGFARDHAGEAMLNSFRWGLENRFHVSTSLAGGDVHPADRKDARTVSVRGQGFLFDPRTLTFELTGGGGQHGMTLDDWGRKFVCENSNPILEVLYDQRYLARSPFVQAPAAAVSVAPEGKYTKLFRISPNEPWRVLRTRLRSQKLVPGWDEGGKPSGFFTGATGVTVYRGNAWPEEYRGSVLVGEVANNLVYRARLEPSGVGVVARRADRDAEFLASSDNWFRPVQFANAPDGSLYVIDMYRELIEGAAFLPPEILKHLDVSSGVDRGRIYRIVPEGFKQPKPPRLGKATTAELVALLEHPNGWHRDTAARLLYQRQDRAALAPLRKLAAISRASLGRVHALYALDGMKALHAEEVVRALGDGDAHVREHAVRLAERFESEAAIRDRLERLCADPNPRVRYQLAFSLVSVQGEMPGHALARLAVRDGGDPWVRLAILSSADRHAAEIVRRLTADRTFRASASGRTFLTALAGQIGVSNRTSAVAAVVKAVDGLPEAEQGLTREIVRSLVKGLPAAARSRLGDGGSGRAGVVLVDLVREARTTAADEKRKPEERAEAVHTLGLETFAGVRALFRELLQPQQPQPVQGAVLETLARFDDPAVARLLLDAWPGLSPRLRATALETCFARPVWISAFLDAVEKGQVKPADVDPARIALLQTSAAEPIRIRARKLFASTHLSKRQDVIREYQKALRLKGDVGRGKVIFKSQCSACHRLEGVGAAIGADLMAIRDRGLDAVMLNILDPNREVKPQFLSYHLVTKTGRTIAGMITAETANSITIRRADGTSETVLRARIEELRSTGLSFMPEGLEKQIDVSGMADLLAYLNSIK